MTVGKVTIRRIGARKWALAVNGEIVHETHSMLRFSSDWGAYGKWNEREAARGVLPATPLTLPAELKRLITPVLHELQEGRCGICGEPLAAQEAELDHIVPVFLGGNDDLQNLQAAHQDCNRSKGGKLFQNGRFLKLRDPGPLQPLNAIASLTNRYRRASRDGNIEAAREMAARLAGAWARRAGQLASEAHRILGKAAKMASGE